MNDNDYIPYDAVPILGVLVCYDSVLVPPFSFTCSRVLRVDFWRRHVWQQLAHFRPSVNTHNTVSKQMFPYELGHHLVVSRNTLLYESTDYTVSQKNVLPLTCYNLGIHNPITIIFGRNVTEKVRNHMMLCFPTSHV